MLAAPGPHSLPQQTFGKEMRKKESIFTVPPK
jgi:hypothetical protein